MKAQTLYDERDRHALIDGQELHEIFNVLCGDPSPSGRVEIDPNAMVELAATYRQQYANHKASGGIGGEYILDKARFLEQFGM